MSPSQKNLKKEHLRVAQECELIANRKISDWMPTHPDWITEVGCALTRLSTEHQSSTELGSLEQQIHLAFAEAAERSTQEHRNYKIEKVFIEAGISGRLGNRPALRLMLDGIKRGKYKFVIIKELSRIARNLSLWKEVFEICIQAGCQIMIKGFPFNPNDPNVILQLDIRAAFAEFESRQTGQRVKSSVNSALISSGKFNSSHKLLGFDPTLKEGRAVPGLYTPNSEEIEIVRFIMQTFIKNGSYSETLDILKSSNIVDKNGKSFSHATLRRLLTDLRYTGEWECNRKNKNKNPNLLMPYERYVLVKLPFGPQIDLELWKNVQETVARINQKTKTRNKNLAAPYLLSTLLQASDGSSFHGTSAHGKMTRKRYYYNNRHKLRLPADPIEEEARRILVNTITQSKDFKEAILSFGKNKEFSTQTITSEIAALKRQEEDFIVDKKRLDRRLDLLLDGADENEIRLFKADYKEKLKEIEEGRLLLAQEIYEKEKGLQELQAMVANPTQLSETAHKVLDHLNRREPAAVKTAYRTLFEQIVAEPDPASGTMKLIFSFRQNSDSAITEQENYSVTSKMVGGEGLEPPIPVL